MSYDFSFYSTKLNKKTKLKNVPLNLKQKMANDIIDIPLLSKSIVIRYTVDSKSIRMNRKNLSKTPGFLWSHSSLDSLIINLSRVRDNSTKD